MSSRILALRRGKTGEVQSFSQARPFDPAVVDLVQSTVSLGINPALRTQVLSDPANVHQFACAFGDTFGFFTRPAIVAGDGGAMIVVGNFTDTLGEPLPAWVPLAEFQGHFTTLVRRGDAQTFGLPTHPAMPDTVEGRLHNGRAYAATLERLNFAMPENPVEGDHPVIVGLPTFLPIGPGQTFPHLLAADDQRTFRDTFPLFEVWRQGVTYSRANNENHSVTTGGPLFNLAMLEIPDGQDDPFATLSIRGGVPRLPSQLLPTDPHYTAGRDRLLAWSDSIWVELGASMEVEPPPAVGGGFTPEHFRAAMEPLVPKEKTFSSAARSLSRYQLLLAAAPAADAAHPDRVVLPDLRDEFKSYLTVASSATAGDDLREIIKSRLTLANNSQTSIDKDVTLEPENITLAFSDRVRTFSWLSERLVSTSHVGAKGTLGLLQLLTPDRDALAVVAEGDHEAATLLMANSTSSSAQLDASKASKLYCSGRLTTFRHSYEAVCNFRCLVSAMVEDLGRPLVLQKLLEYSALLVDRQGRFFFESYKHSPHLAVHPWQDLQSILSAFCTIATESTLYSAVTKGEPVALVNYKSAIAVADALISDLRAILAGNGLGKFEGTPSCALWFSASPIPARGVVAGSTQRAVSRLSPSGDVKRQKTQETPVTDRNKVVTFGDQSESERRKSLGILTFDTTASGTSRLPTISVYHKKKNAKTPERLCMKFLTQGFSCDRTDCKLPHLTNIDVLPPADKTKLIEFVKKQPGLAWAEGKAPAGTS